MARRRPRLKKLARRTRRPASSLVRGSQVPAQAGPVGFGQSILDQAGPLPRPSYLDREPYPGFLHELASGFFGQQGQSQPQPPRQTQLGPIGAQPAFGAPPPGLRTFSGNQQPRGPLVRGRAQPSPGRRKRRRRQLAAGFA